jgi:hypothetical protein
MKLALQIKFYLCLTLGLPYGSKVFIKIKYYKSTPFPTLLTIYFIPAGINMQASEMIILDTYKFVKINSL